MEVSFRRVIISPPELKGSFLGSNDYNYTSGRYPRKRAREIKQVQAAESKRDHFRKPGWIHAG